MIQSSPRTRTERLSLSKGVTSSDTLPRQQIESAIEALIAMLDAIDGDADCEDDGSTEPSLERLNNGGHSWRDGNVDLEEAHR